MINKGDDLKSSPKKDVKNLNDSNNLSEVKNLNESNNLSAVIDTSKPFNQTNPYETSYCPYATCFNSPLCAPCNQRYLFILATGRSGSTSLLKMFNHLPNVRLSGENYNILYEAAKLTTFLEKDKHKRYFLDDKTRKKGLFMREPLREGAFQHNGMPVGSMACVPQTLLRTVNPPDFMNTISPYHESQDEKNIIGAKLIRIQNGEWDPWESVQFFKNNFPCARFVINIRSNEEKQLDSISSAFGGVYDKSKEKLENQTEFLKSFHTLMGDEASRLIDLSEWKDDVSIINDVVEWLGFEQCNFDSIRLSKR